MQCAAVKTQKSPFKPFNKTPPHQCPTKPILGCNSCKETCKESVFVVRITQVLQWTVSWILCVTLYMASYIWR
jgi:hypothetical protein